MNSKVSTASFSTSACWLGVRILDSLFGGGVTGAEIVLRFFVRSGGGCFFVASERRDARATISAGGANEGPAAGASTGREVPLASWSRQNDSYAAPTLIGQLGSNFPGCRCSEIRSQLVALFRGDRSA